MGIQGARSLLEEDPRRYGQPWRCNWENANEEDASEKIGEAKEEKSHDNKNNNDNESANDDKVVNNNGQQQHRQEGEPLILLVDGMSLLYHVTVNKNQSGGGAGSESSIHASPSAIKDQVSRFVSQLQRALPANSELRIFLDGLAPKLKIETQIDRLRNQALEGDLLAKLSSKVSNRYNPKATKKVLPLLAEWAMVEAIEELRKQQLALLKANKIDNNNINKVLLELHRPSRGEAEAYIDFWIARKVPRDRLDRTFILADDTDFLVYPNCRGFITFQSLEIQVDQKDSNIVRLSGFQFMRQRFLDSFLPPASLSSPSSSSSSTPSATANHHMVIADDAMPVVAALAGCDYILNPETQQGLVRAQRAIVKSDIGGLREKARNNPSKAQQLTAMLRYVAHFIKSDHENWVEALCRNATASSSNKSNNKGKNGNNGVDDNNKKEMIDEEMKDPNSKDSASTILKDAFLAIRKAYFRSLTQPANPSFEKKPSSVEIRRLLEFGIFYCRPVIEAWEPASYDATYRKRSLEDIHTAMDSSSYAIVISPPFTRQVASWIQQDSIWRMPHFQQARLRLNCLLVQFARTGGSYSFEGGQLRLSPMWTNENPKVTEYVRSNNNGGKDATGEPTLRMLERIVEIPSYDFVSAGWGDEAELLSGDDAVDRACLFCIIGNIKQAKPALNPILRNSGTLFLASLFLPYNLALLLILMGTRPPLETVDLAENLEPVSHSELNRVFPLMSVTCFHAIFISNTLLSLFGTHSEEQKRSNLASHGHISGGGDDSTRGIFRVSDVVNHDVAVWIWNATRDGADLEQLRSDDSDDCAEMQFAVDYLDNAMDNVKAQLPDDDYAEWEGRLEEWKKRAKILWVIWWEVFNASLSPEAGHMHMEE